MAVALHTHQAGEATMEAAPTQREMNSETSVLITCRQATVLSRISLKQLYNLNLRS